MALVPATITVNFTSNYTGNHRVCYRLGGVGPYDCTTIVACLGGGTPCSTTINVTVDDEACTDYVYDGYVQAVCEAEASTTGRVAWTATYTPTNACFSILFTAGGGGSAPGFDLGADASCGGTRVIVPSVATGTEFTLCFPAGTTFSAPAEYTRVPGATDCCTCEQVTFSCPGGALGGTYFYQDCTTKEFMSGTMNAADPDVIVCALVDSAGVESGSGITTAIGVCP